MPPPSANSDDLTATERRFLLQALETHEALKPVASPDNLIPLLKWRTIGAFCGLSAPESDRLVQELSARGLVQVHDESQHTMLLSRGADLARQAYEAATKRARRIRDALLALAAALLFVLYTLSTK
jgi:hypothetical protein